jgi:general secretion pathway protein D
LAVDAAKQHFQLGQAAEKRGQDLEAYAQYLQARAAAPDNRKYLRAADRLRAVTAQAIAIRTAAETVEAPDGLGKLDLPPAGDLEQDDLLREALGPTELEFEHRIASFRIDGTIQEAYERVFREYGIDVIFDEGFRGSTPTKFHLDDVGFDDAVITLNEVATAFVIPLTAKLALIANDTPAKRSELEPVVTISVPIPEAVTPQDATEAAQAVQQTLEMRRLFVVPSQNIVTIRDSPAKARMARLLLERLLLPTSELVLEIELIAYNQDSERELGLSLPYDFPVTNYSTILNATPPESDASGQILVGGGDSLLGIGVGSSRLVALLRAGAGSMAQELSVRATDGKEAQVRIGERFPIITASFQPGSGLDPEEPDADFVLPPPSVTFEDLGLSVNVTPSVHGSGEVSLHLQAEFNLLAGGSVNGIPILVNRTLETQIRLDEGESAIIAGMAIDETRRTRNTPLGLAGIPVVSTLLSQQKRTTNSTDLLVIVTPRVVRLPASEIVRELRIRFGSEERPLSAF